MPLPVSGSGSFGQQVLTVPIPSTAVQQPPSSKLLTGGGPLSGPVVLTGSRLTADMVEVVDRGSPIVRLTALYVEVLIPSGRSFVGWGIPL